MKKNSIYYLFLLIKKIRIFFHNKFEIHVKFTEWQNFEDVKIILWQHFLKNLVIEENGAYFQTRVRNKNFPMVLSQARAILILSMKGVNSRFENNYLVQKLSDYLLGMRMQNGLFNFNQVSWDLQDEGIASVWSTLALVKAFEKTNIIKYLNAAISTCEAMYSNLYSPKTSLLHTAGENIWCLNSASTFANACAILLEHHYSDKIKEAMIDSINLCIEKLAEDGHYPYNERRQGTYLLLYHPIVMITLKNCLKSKYIDNNLAERINQANKKAEKFLLSCFDKSGRLFEPEIKHYFQYIITNITSLVALKNSVSISEQKNLIKNIIAFFSDSDFHLCKDENNLLFNSDLYSVKDVLAIELLYWISIYQSEEQYNI